MSYTHHVVTCGDDDNDSSDEMTVVENSQNDVVTEQPRNGRCTVSYEDDERYVGKGRRNGFG